MSRVREPGIEAGWGYMVRKVYRERYLKQCLVNEKNVVTTTTG